MRYFTTFLAFGLPFLIGFGVLPIPTFINEIWALLGFGLLLAAMSRERVSLRLGPGYVWVQGAIALLLMLTAAQAMQSQVAGAGESYVLVGGYLVAAAVAFHAGWRGGLDPDLRAAWTQALCASVTLAAVLAALGGATQYFGLAGESFLLPGLQTAGRAYGFIRQPNHQASFLVVGVVALGYLARRRQLPGVAYLVIGLVLVAGVLMSGSRLGVVMLGAALLALYVQAGPGHRRLYALLLLAVPLTAGVLWLMHAHGVATFHGLARVQQTASEGAGVRLQVWAETAREISRSPWLGPGLLRFGQWFFLSDATVRTGAIMSHAHNLFLQLAFDFGVPAAIAVAVALGRVLWGGRTGWRDPARVTALGMVAVVGLHSLFEFPLWYLYFLLPAMFALGLFGSAGAAAPVAFEPRPAGRERSLVAAAGGVAIAASVWINHDYYKITDLFLGLLETPSEQTLASARKVAWFGHYARYMETVSMQVNEQNAAAYWDGMQSAACLLLTPLYQAPMVMALAHQGKLVEAQRLAYIYSELGMNHLEYLRRQVASTPGQSFEALGRYLADPRPVELPPSRILPCLR